jgi:uncharacterized repeat protein (TIGR03803 family)
MKKRPGPALRDHADLKRRRSAADGVCARLRSFARLALSTGLIAVAGAAIANGQVVVLTPAGLTFTDQLVNTTSGVQTVFVSNGGIDNLIFANGSITLSGANAADFAIVSNGCNGATVISGSACSADIAFTPSIVGTETATLSLADNAAGSPQTVSLTGTGISSPPSSLLPTNETILYGFAGPWTGGTGADGAYPYEAGLVSDASGNLYGTTYSGGTAGLGTVFELVNSSGIYSERLLYSFAGPPFGGPGADAANPASSLIMDSAGNLYGTTPKGGRSGLGTVFELVNSSGTYTEKVLYSFTGVNGDGAIPYAVALVRDSAGNLYGTTQNGGAVDSSFCTSFGGCGTVFELVNSAASPGIYTEKVLYSFSGTSGDAVLPQTGLAVDQAGDFFGTSGAGGALGWGAVYELVNSSGSYEERTVYSFSDGVYADYVATPVIVDMAGNLYGTTPTNLNNTGYGTVFELVNSTTSPGTYTMRTLYTFTGGSDGGYPFAALTEDAAGNLYGTGTLGAGTNSGGNVFELANVSGSYVFKVLYSFGGRLYDADDPGPLLLDSTGNLYGTTEYGGNTGGQGTVFRLSSAVPPSVPAIWLSYSSLTTESEVGVQCSNGEPFVAAANIGNASLIFDPGATITGTNAADFVISGDSCSGRTAAPGAICSVGIAFTPSVIGAESATLSFSDNAANSPQTVSLIGIGLPPPVALLSPASLTFGPQLVHTTSGVQTLSINNSGGATVNLAVSLSGPNVGDFDMVSNSCGLSLFQGIACSVGIAFTPSIAGTETATLSFSDNAAGSPQTVGLTGTGVSSPTGSGSLLQDEIVLHNFQGGVPAGSATDGASPSAGLLSDTSGNLYGTTYAGGTAGQGTVFELVNASGSYTEKLLYSFARTPDGSGPESRLIMDSSGNLYGTTYGGGTNGVGTVFELVSSSGTYTEKVLYSFTGFAGDGANPLYGALYRDSAGNLYGTTEGGGGDLAGTVFELVNDPAAPGTYAEKVLHSFANFDLYGPGDGVIPFSALTADNAGNLYGTTHSGGAYGYGTVYELVNSSGGYVERILYSFSGGSDGAYPTGSVTLDSAGNLYGTTSEGGTLIKEGTAGASTVTVFELENSKASPGTYTMRILYSFTGGPSESPLVDLMADAAGNLFGTTSEGGTHGYYWGTVFELANASGSYVFNTLYNFGSTSADGENPQGRLLEDSAGNLYGTTYGGGTGGLGTVFVLRASGPYVTLSASNLAFANVIVGTPSAAQTVTVTNSGNENLTFGAGTVTISGANAADFALSADACSGATIPPAGTCSVGVTFTPSVAGAESADLSFADNAPYAPQTVALSGTGGTPDFSIGMASGSSSSASILPGGTATYSLSIGSLYGFAQTVSLTCSIAASEATCAVSPATVNPTGASPASVTVTVSTTAPSVVPPHGPTGDHRLPTKLELLALELLALVMLAARSAAPRLGIKPTGRRRYGLGVILLAAALFASCGGGGGGSGGGGNSNPGTPAGTYTLTVTGTSGGLTHSTTLTVKVN